MEYISPEGLRLDGRRANEIRQLRVKIGGFEAASGSAFVEQGNTRILAVVFGPHESKLRSRAKHDCATINCEYSMATFSTIELRQRAKGDRKGTEMELQVTQALTAAVMTKLYPRTQIDVYIQVLQADGGELAGAINAASLALIDAGVAMKDYVCACTAGHVDGSVVLDLNRREATARGAVLTIASMPKSGKISLCLMNSRVHIDQYEELQSMAVKGCSAVKAILRQAVLDRTQALLPSLGPPS